MFATLEAKLIAVALGLFLLAGAAVGAYAAYEHNLAQKSQIQTLQADNAREAANTAAALQEASGLQAALTAASGAQASAKVTHHAAVTRLASAVAASPAVASTVVPESYWQAIYGSDNAQ
ncbi:hypothetical protein [Pararobbsia alpina]|uniref:Uncharacterized protein n=1 Tax=Pararobbsia alpina TaxID=621374 RepID=A0A6S7BCC3_9BURK|nr:hypothetical protein [Pararobbsia alpina]CAB3795428.1 hypothetical protein LMG28138_03878 [Pararobbsia alpina]